MNATTDVPKKQEREPNRVIRYLFWKWKYIRQTFLSNKMLFLWAVAMVCYTLFAMRVDSGTGIVMMLAPPTLIVLYLCYHLIRAILDLIWFLIKTMFKLWIIALILSFIISFVCQLLYH